MEIRRNSLKLVETPRDRNKYIALQDLEVYRLARELSKIGWEIYEPLDWQTKKIIGDQFMESTDSIGANIAEGYARYHYLDKIKFLYNARGSLAESSDHWLELLRERKKANDHLYRRYKEVARETSVKLQNFISANYQSRSR